MKKIIYFFVVICLSLFISESTVYALANVLLYNGEKVYSESKITKGKKRFTKKTSGQLNDYQIVKMSKRKITLRPQKGLFQSVDPYFKKKVGFVLL